MTIPKTSGVYVFLHRASGMVYVGSAVNMKKRYNEYLFKARTDGETIFYRALREFGIDSFDFEVIQECPKEQLLERERFWIAFFGSATVDGFNTRTNPIATYDTKISEATRARMRAAKVGHAPSFEARSKGGKAHKGKKKSPESVAKVAAALRGRKATPEAIEANKAGQRKRTDVRICSPAARVKIAETLKQKGIVPPSRKGTTTSDEVRAKQSTALTGRLKSKEHKIALSVAASNRSAEHLAKVQAAKIGKPRSEECKAKIRAALLGRKRKPAYSEK